MSFSAFIFYIFKIFQIEKWKLLKFIQLYFVKLINTRISKIIENSVNLNYISNFNILTFVLIGHVSICKNINAYSLKLPY